MQIVNEYQLLYIPIDPQLPILPFNILINPVLAHQSWSYKPTYRKCILVKKNGYLLPATKVLLLSEAKS